MQKSDEKGILDIINGLRNVGLSELSEVGLTEAEYFIIPDVFIRDFVITTDEDEKYAKAYAQCKNRANVKAAKLPDALAFDGKNLMTRTGAKLTYELKPISNKDQDRALSTIIEHFKNLAEPVRTLKICANMVCLAFGWIQDHEKSESSVVKTLEEVKDKEAIEKYKKILAKDTSAIQGLCVSATLNHWLTNHSLGGNLKNSLLDRSYSFTSIAADFPLKGKNLRDSMYTVVHAVDKRNCLHSFASHIPGLSALISLGMPVNTELFADKSIALRVNSIPAGNRRIDIAIALIKFAYENDILACSKSITLFKEIIALKERALKIGVAAHLGAKFYSYAHPKEQVYRDLVNAKVNEVIADYGNVVMSIAPESSLSLSPIVTSCVASNPRKPVIERAKALLAEVSKSAEEFAKSIQEEYLKTKYAISDAKNILAEVGEYIARESEIIYGTKEEKKE